MSFSFSSFVPAPSFIERIDKSIEPLNYPECPGVYVMVDKDDKVIYTEQAENLRTTMKTYATSNCGSEVLNEVTKGNVKEIKIFCCQTKLDAAILEHYFINLGIYLGRYNNQQAKENTEGIFKETATETNGDFEKEKCEAPRSLAEEVQRLLDANNTLVTKIIDQQNSFNDHFLNTLEKNGNQIESLVECVRELTESVKITTEKAPGKKKIFNL